MLQAFREKVAHYLEEARIGVKLLTLAPSLADAREKSRHIRDLCTRLPDIPPGVDPVTSIVSAKSDPNWSDRLVPQLDSMQKDLAALMSDPLGAESAHKTKNLRPTE